MLLPQGGNYICGGKGEGVECVDVSLTGCLHADEIVYRLTESADGLISYSHIRFWSSVPGYARL